MNIKQSDNTILKTTRLTKRFGGLVAVGNMDLEIRRGTIHSLIGPNGAGKTTFFNIITGIYKPDEGGVLFNGKSIGGMRSYKIVKQGIARTFQNIRLFPHMTCLENVMAGQHCRSKAGVWSSIIKTKGQRKEETRIRQTAQACLEKVGLNTYQDELAKNIAYGQQRMLEIARALACQPSLLVLDEPSSGLNDKESEDLIGFLRALVCDRLTILIIEHDIKVVMGISDWVTVMQNGHNIAQGPPETIYNDPLVVEAYLGKDDDDDDDETV